MGQKRRNIKKPIISTNLTTRKKLPSYLGPPNLENRHLAWRFSSADLDGPYSCAKFTYGDFVQLWNRLRAFETKNPDELRRTGSFHIIPIPDFCKEAKDRLMEINLDDLEELYSFRMDGACRLFCMKHENLFCILWWDNDHKACQVEKSHT